MIRVSGVLRTDVDVGGAEAQDRTGETRMTATTVPMTSAPMAEKR